MEKIILLHLNNIKSGSFMTKKNFNSFLSEKKNSYIKIVNLRKFQEK